MNGFTNIFKCSQATIKSYHRKQKITRTVKIVTGLNRIQAQEKIYGKFQTIYHDNKQSIFVERNKKLNVKVCQNTQSC